MFPSVALPELILYAIAGLCGLAVCFFGYRLFRIWLVLAGLQIGFYLGLWLGQRLFANNVPAVFLAVAAAVLLAGLFGLIIRIGAFLAGAGILLLATALIVQLFPFAGSVYALLGAGLIGGLLGVFLLRPFLILSTAINGAFLVADSVANLLIGTPVTGYVALHQQLGAVRLILLLTGIIVLAILGCLVQFRTTQQKPSQSAGSPPGTLLDTGKADAHGSQPPAPIIPRPVDQPDQAPKATPARQDEPRPND